MFQPSAPPGRPAAAQTFKALRDRTPTLSGAERAERFDTLPTAVRESLWTELGERCAAEIDRRLGEAGP
ncbi:MAG: hypothetical protein H0U12_05010 [Thermoleophilaceae bacterium]|nr:hypothetical protein [Thermoleophilaceae bacterium]